MRISRIQIEKVQNIHKLDFHRWLNPDPKANASNELPKILCKAADDEAFN